ncbi:MAG: GNAT family N-acetyltransferase [Chloroflexi bacterium]|nr:GNAT family N-acetyltransferase [Chloroflexota bacterium]
MQASAGISIRRFTDEDAPDVSRLILADLWQINARDYGTVAVNALAHGYTPERLRQYARQGAIYVALLAGEIAGTASLQGDRVRNVFVRVDCHKQGIGTALMQHVEKMAQQQGIKRLFLLANLAAVDFYHNLGYVSITEITEPIGPTVLTLVRMEKALS